MTNSDRTTHWRALLNLGEQKQKLYEELKRLHKQHYLGILQGKAFEYILLHLRTERVVYTGSIHARLTNEDEYLARQIFTTWSTSTRGIMSPKDLRSMLPYLNHEGEWELSRYSTPATVEEFIEN